MPNKVELRKLKLAFYSHRHTARAHGRAFLLTFDQWFEIWQASGHLKERGRKRGQYCMARFGDVGPYAVGNVRICTVTENHHEAHCGKPLTTSHRANLSKAFRGRRLSADQRAKLSKAHSGKILSAMHKVNISRATRGTRNGNASLTMMQVRHMRRLRQKQRLNLRTLANMFGVSVSTASNVIRGANYVE